VEQNAEMALSIAHQAIVFQTGSIALSGPAVELQKDERVKGLYLGSKQSAEATKRAD
jgi:branched-chain amino acid transport system ATP-binding protein